MISISITWYLKHLACPPSDVKFYFELVSLFHDYFITLRHKIYSIILTVLITNLIYLMKKGY